MSRLMSATRYPDTQEIEYITDDFCRIVHDERTGEWTLFRIPFPNDILAASLGFADSTQRITEITAPVRYVPPVLADAQRPWAVMIDGHVVDSGVGEPPHFDAEVSVDD